MRRREFIAAVGGVAAGWPFTARAQQRERMLKVGVLVSFAETDPEGQTSVALFRKALQELGWTEGGNVQFFVRWALFQSRSPAEIDKWWPVIKSARITVGD